MKENLLQASCRIAFAALIHDLGKFYQRSELATVQDIDKQLYCPFRNEHFTHIHAAFTAAAIDKLSSYLPPLRGENVFPFQSSRNRDIDDSLINAAAKHHKAETVLQKVISEADRLSAAFERQEYEKYTYSSDSDDYISARLACLFDLLDKEKIQQEDIHSVYPLKPLFADSLFPEIKKSLSSDEASNEYKELWQSFEESLKQMTNCASNLNLWLDNFDSLWLTYTQAIPSASAFKSGSFENKTVSNVSLYDHSKSTAALATALWRYEYETEKNESDIEDANEFPFLIIQGDISGIQNFIFAQGSETQKKAAQILRGRSFLISLFSECAALKILDTLNLPSTSQVINAAGHFMIVAPNTPTVVSELKNIKKEMEAWFYDKMFATVSIAVAWEKASKNDFTAHHFPSFQNKLHQNIDKAKLSQMDLCGVDYKPVFTSFPLSCDAVCENDGQFPTKNGKTICSLCEDIEKIGSDLTQKKYLIIGHNLENAFATEVFGYQVVLSKSLPSDTTLSDEKRMKRVWDISLPTDEKNISFSASFFAKRSMNAYVPQYEDATLMPFETLADEAEGVPSLMTFKGDIDNLGFLFQSRLKHKTFASYAALSRLINNFFTLFVPTFCQKTFSSVYTIFAGGDDFFFIAPWNKQILFVNEVKKKFDEYVCGQLTFSAGLLMMSPKLPVRIVAELTEDNLKKAKASVHKNSVCCYGQVVDFQTFNELIQAGEFLDRYRETCCLSTGFIYRLISFCQMAQNAERNPKEALWRSWIMYRITRHCKNNNVDNGNMQTLTQFLIENIEKYKAAFQITLFINLYKQREKEE